jgi:hypothetical protein
MLALASYYDSASSLSSRGGGLTLLFISLALILVGGVLVFDLGGFASKSHEYNTGFTPWGRRLAARDKIPSPYRIVGWVFLAPGVGLLILAVISLIS